MNVKKLNNVVLSKIASPAHSHLMTRSGDHTLLSDHSRIPVNLLYFVNSLRSRLTKCAVCDYINMKKGSYDKMTCFHVSVTVLKNFKTKTWYTSKIQPNNNNNINKPVIIIIREKNHQQINKCIRFPQNNNPKTTGALASNIS